MNDPIDNIEWRNAEELNANHYNPNVVYGPEFRLLEHSILINGWLHPIIISREDIIIDGFHRWTLSKKSKPLKDKYDGKLPTVKLDVGLREAMMITIRINRAKGSHIACRMSDLVKELIDKHHTSIEEIMEGIGATKDEVELLYQDSIFKRKKMKEYEYSKAWEPRARDRG